MSDFINIEEIIKSTTGGAEATIQVLKDLQFSDTKLFDITRHIYDTLHVDTLYTDFWGMWGYSRLGTYGACLTAAFFHLLMNYVGMPEISQLNLVATVSCAIGVFALNTDLIGAAITGRTAGVYEVGYRYVDGVGDVFNVTQIARSGTQTGYLGETHFHTVPHDSLYDRGYIDTKTFVLYSSRKRFPTVYGIEAIHSDGYTTLCIDQNAAPSIIVKGMLSNEPGATFDNGATGLICSSFVNEGYVDGLWVHKPKNGVLDLPLLAKKELAEGAGIKVSSLADNETAVESGDLEDSEFNYWKELDVELQSMEEPESSVDQEEDGDDSSEVVSSQGWFRTKSKAQIIGSASYKKEEGAFKSLLISNYVNGYGPPVDFLAGV